MASSGMVFVLLAAALCATFNTDMFEYMRNFYDSLTWDDISPFLLGVGGALLLIKTMKFCFRAFRDAVFVRSRTVKRLHVLTSMASDPVFGSQCKTSVALEPSAVNVPLGTDRYTPFLRVCWCGSADIVKFMLEQGADVTRTTAAGETPLHLAAYHVSKLKDYWDPTCLQLLIEAGCSVNATTKEGNTALHFAAKEGHVCLTRFLLLHGADPEISNKMGFKPYQVAQARFTELRGDDYAEAIRLLTVCVEKDDSKVLKLDWKEDGVLLTVEY